MKSFLNERIVKGFENFQFLVAVGIAVCSKDADLVIWLWLENLQKKPFSIKCHFAKP